MSDTTDAAPPAAPANESGPPAPATPAAPAPATDAAPTPATAETAPEVRDGNSAEDAAARIAELQRQLDEAAPILQAHKDAEDARKSELQRANERAAELEAERDRLRDEASRARVAEATGLTSAQVAFLRGSTEDELMKAAKAFASAAPSGLRTRSTPTVGNGASSAGSEPDKDTPAAMAEKIRAAMPY
ncbi:hypothetical protein [Nocardiopsis alba]|uniref:hypothetical protein n=1 Tax=Nocardiopsis alba TaxID=53437 RepID=UPI003D754B35